VFERSENTGERSSPSYTAHINIYMKVTEIITTETLSEAWGAGLLGKAAGYFTKSAAMDRLVAKWTEELATHGKILTKAPGNIVGPELAKDRDFITKAIAKVRKDAPKAVRQYHGGIIGAGVRKVADNAAGLITALTTAGISAASAKQYNDTVNELQKQLDAGQITPDEFEIGRQKAMTLLVGQVTLSLGAWGALKSVSAMPVAIINKFVPGFAAVASGLSAYGMVQASNWLRSEQGRQALAFMFIDGFIDTSPLFGGVPVSWLDKFKSMVPGFNKTPAPAGTPQKMGQAPAAAPMNTTTTQKMGQPVAVPGTDISTTMTGPNSFDVAYTK